ncbi:MAG: hypothetical protein K8Q92_07695 [Methylophilales bacterium]|nr:hypothetical protein [Methylophilales bacterium]
MERRKLLVTGCGRSGTRYAAMVWQSCGLDIRHERPMPPDGLMGADGMASWYMALEESNPPPPHGPSRANYQFDHVIHQVRHPLLAIASAAQFIFSHDPRPRIYIMQNVPEIHLKAHETKLDITSQKFLLAMRYWLHWNLLAERSAHRTIQVEQLLEKIPELLGWMDIKNTQMNADKIPKDTNRRSDYLKNETIWTITWEQMSMLEPTLCLAIAQLAERYGYSTS